MSRRSYINSRLPWGYQELQYVESTGQAYFKVSFTPYNVNPGFDIIWKMDSGFYGLAEEQDMFGVYASSGFTAWYLYRGSASGGNANKVLYNFTTGTAKRLNSNMAYNDTFQECKLIDHTFTACDGTVTTNVGDPRSGSYYGYIGIGGLWNGGTQSFYQRTNTTYKMYFKYLAIYRGTTKAFEFIPCRRQSDGKVGFYDLSNGNFHASESNVDFVAGPEVW